jgi:hypothetical protein
MCSTDVGGGKRKHAAGASAGRPSSQGIDRVTAWLGGDLRGLRHDHRRVKRPVSAASAAAAGAMMSPVSNTAITMLPGTISVTAGEEFDKEMSVAT